MEKEQILSTLTEKLGKTTISSRSLDTYVSNNLPSEGTEPDDAWFAKHVNVLKSFAGQYSHDLATAIEDFKKSYKPNGDHEDPPVDSDLAKALERIKALEDAAKEAGVKQSVDKLRGGVLGKAAELKVSSYKNEWEDAVNSVDLSDCKTEDEALTKVKTEFERLVKRYHGDNAKPYGKGSEAPKYSDTESKNRRDAYLKRLQAEGKVPSAQ